MAVADTYPTTDGDWSVGQLFRYLVGIFNRPVVQALDEMLEAFRHERVPVICRSNVWGAVWRWVVPGQSWGELLSSTPIPTKAAVFSRCRHWCNRGGPVISVCGDAMRK